MAVKEINIAFATPVSILIENTFSTFNFQNAPLNWSEGASKFLQPANHHIRVEVTGNRVNRGVGLGLEISVNYFLWRCKSYNKVKNTLEKLDNELQMNVKKFAK